MSLSSRRKQSVRRRLCEAWLRVTDPRAFEWLSHVASDHVDTGTKMDVTRTIVARFAGDDDPGLANCAKPAKYNKTKQ